ncbi:MAG: PGF-pre-PGF domain-containing protein [Candidatus Aenigmarchaeota archaeon]|nr:PGF-pre-PGF domain-containing protein [Candidatus Aenigmarchaeota archaeon]
MTKSDKFFGLEATKIFFLSIFFVLAFGCATFATTFDFWGYTYDVNGNPINGTNVTMTLYNYSNWTDPIYDVYWDTSDANGFFNVSGIDSVPGIMYKPTVIHYNGTRADYIGKSLPTFPLQEIENLTNISFYLQEAATINLTVFGKDLEISELSSKSINNSFKTGLAYNPNTNRFFVLNSSDCVLVYNSSFGYVSSSSGATLNNATALAFCSDMGLLYVANKTNITSYNSDWTINSSWDISGYNLTKIFDIECYQGIWYLSTYNGSFTGILKLNLTPGQAASKTGDVSLDTKYVGSIEHYVGDTAGWYLAYNDSGTYKMQIFDNNWAGGPLLWKPYTFSKQVDGLVNANGTWYYSSAQDKTTNEFEFAIADKYFNYMVKDTKLGYPVAENFAGNMVRQATIFLPADRNYSIMVYPNCSMPASYNLNNISDYGTSPYINIRINVTEVNTWVYGTLNYNGSTSFDNITIVPYILEPGNMVFKDSTMPYNMSAWRPENYDNISDNNVSDQYNASAGFYNITIPGNTLGNNVLLFAIAKNGTDYYGGFKNISIGASGSDMNVNITLYKLIGNETNITMYDAQSWNETKIPVLMKRFQVFGPSGSPVNSAHVEVQIDYSSFGGATFSWMIDINNNANGTFSVPIYNASISRINIFSQDSAPLKTSLSTTDLQNDTVQIHLNSFRPGGISSELAEGDSHTVTDYTKGLEYSAGKGWRYLNGTDKLVKYNSTFGYNETVDLSSLTSITSLSAFYIDNETELYMNTTHIDNGTDITNISNLNYTYVSDVDVYENVVFVNAFANISGNTTSVIDVLNATNNFSLIKRNVNDTVGNEMAIGYITAVNDSSGTYLLMAFNDSGTGTVVEYMVTSGYSLLPIGRYELSKIPSGLTYADDINVDGSFAYASSNDSSINIFAISDTFNDLRIGLYKYSDECNVPYPPDSCILGGSEKTFGDDFNPLSVIMGGGKINFRMRKASNNITVQFNNVDMLASGPPDALFDSSSNATQGQSAIAEAWRFGSRGPEIYDNVLLGVPYNNESYNDNWEFTVTIDKFYDASWNVIWERGVNTTGQLSGTDYADFNEGDYANYLGSGVVCSKTDVNMTSHICYVDTSRHMVWMKIPHFSGINPVVNGTALSNGETCSADADCASGHCVHGVCRAGSTYCGDGYCDSGETASSCPADCETGGGTSGGGVTNATELTKSKTRIWAEMSPGVVHEMKIESPEIGLKTIQLVVKSQASHVKIKVTKQDSKPTEIENEPSGKVYKYVKIDTQNLDSEIIENATIQFLVDKNWTVENNIDLDKIYLNRYTTKWQRLDTRRLGEENENYIYEARTPGFSYFAITGEEKTVAPKPKEEQKTEPEKKPVSREKGSETPKTPNTLWAGILVLLVLILAAVFAWKKGLLK